MNLREAAASALKSSQVESDLTTLRYYEKRRSNFLEFFEKRFGRPPDSIEFRKIHAGAQDVILVSGDLTFVSYFIHGSFRFHLRMICPNCGEETLSIQLSSIIDLAHVLADNGPFYNHTCPVKPGDVLYCPFDISNEAPCFKAACPVFNSEAQQCSITVIANAALKILSSLDHDHDHAISLREHHETQE